MNNLKVEPRHAEDAKVRKHNNKSKQITGWISTGKNFKKQFEQYNQEKNPASTVTKGLQHAGKTY